MQERIDELRLKVSTEAEVPTAGTISGFDGQSDEHVDDLRAELSRAVDNLGRSQYEIGKQYPNSQQFRHFRFPTPTRWTVISSRSSLRNEITLEELLAFNDAEDRSGSDDDAAWSAWYEDWNDEWSESSLPWPAEDSNGGHYDPIDAVPSSHKVSPKIHRPKVATISLSHASVNQNELSDSGPSLRRASGFSEEEEQQQRVDLDLLVNGLSLDTSDADNAESLRSLGASTHNWQGRVGRSLPPCHSIVTHWIEV